MTVGALFGLQIHALFGNLDLEFCATRKQQTNLSTKERQKARRKRINIENSQVLVLVHLSVVEGNSSLLSLDPESLWEVRVIANNEITRTTKI